MSKYYLLIYFILFGTFIKTGNDILTTGWFFVGVIILALIPVYRKKRKESIKQKIKKNETVLNVNKAAWWELEELPGVLRVQAKKIVWNRKHNGLYTSKEDFFEKNNIKDKQTIDKLIFI